MASFLIITTYNLPEAYFLADFLLRKGQRVGFLNIQGRTQAQQFKVLNRIRKKRGILYILNLALGKLLRSRYQSASAVPFPEITPESMKRAREAMTYRDCLDPHESATLEFVRQFGPDYILVAGAPILKESLFGLAKISALNRHLGLAPKYRGSDCPLWAIRNREFDQIGYTIHVVAKKVDGGKVLLQEAVKPDPTMSFSRYLAYVNRQGSEGYLRVLDRIIASGMITGVEQIPAGEHYPPAGLTTLRHASNRWKEYQQSQFPLPIVCYAEDWGRLPSSTQHLMRGLSVTHPILWVDSMGLRTPSVASSGDIRRITAKVRKFAKGIREVEPNISVLSPLVLPFPRYAVIRQFNSRLMRVYIGRYLKQKGYNRFIQWSSSPTSANMIHALNESANVYYIGDEFSEFTQFDRKLVTALERELLVKSDLLMVVSDRLYKTKSVFNGVVEKIPHGCDYRHFSRTSSLTEADIPADLKNIKAPRIGYYGLIRDWFDFPMLKDIFTRHLEWSLVLVGPSDTDTSVLADLPNVHLLGAKRYEELPQYLRGFDVAIIPYRKTEITLNANPLKLLEYLSSGVPVVTTDLPSVMPYRAGLHLASNTAEFERGIEQSLAETGTTGRETRQAIARDNSWQSRVKLVESEFAKHVYPLTQQPTKPVVMHLIAAMNVAGAEKVILNLLRASRTGRSHEWLEHRATSFVRSNDGAGSDFLREATEIGALTDRLPNWVRWDLGDIAVLRGILDRHGVKLLHTHGYKADIAGVIAAKLSGIPIIATAHGFSTGIGSLGRNERIGVWFLKFVDRVIAVSENVRQTLLRSGVDENKITLLSNAIDFDYFRTPAGHDLRQDWQIKPEEVVIGTAGRLAVEKAQVNLIKAVELLPEQLRKKVRVVIAGAGPLQHELEAEATRAGLTPQLVMPGFVRDMRAFYQALDIFCLPSLTEGHPLTIMEAAACGIPIVASRVGAIRDLIADGDDGYTADPGDIQRLTDGLQKLIETPDKGWSIGRKLCDKLSQTYAIGPWSDHMDAIYADILKR